MRVCYRAPKEGCCSSSPRPNSCSSNFGITRLKNELMYERLMNWKLKTIELNEQVIVSFCYAHRVDRSRSRWGVLDFVL